MNIHIKEDTDININSFNELVKQFGYNTAMLKVKSILGLICYYYCITKKPMIGCNPWKKQRNEIQRCMK